MNAVVKKKLVRNASHSKAGGKEEKTDALSNSSGAAVALRVLVEPWITEKSHQIMAMNKYVFKVVKSADKKAVKKAIEDLYKVHVENVNIVNTPRKKRIQGRTKGWKPGYKKAVVTLKEGEKIELFEGV